MRMNASPSKFQYYKRFMNNKGDINIPGYDPLTGKKGNRMFNSSQLSKKPLSSTNSPARDQSKLETTQTFPTFPEIGDSRLR